VKVGIFAKKIDKEFVRNLEDLFDSLNIINANVWLHPDLLHIINNILFLNIKVKNLIDSELLPDDIDFFITIGGDGTFLEALPTIKNKDIPLLGINTGRLGFLADISPVEIRGAINAIANNEYKIEHRAILQVKLTPVQGIDFPFALNDLTIHKRDTSSMIKIKAYIDDSFLATYWADGLIISTPTGSTAYSMSVGGPIVSPDSKNLIITPIASHNLTVRPLVIPDNHKISLKIDSRDSKFLLSLDARSFAIEKTLEVQVEKAENTIPLIKLNNYCYYSTLRNKLMWGIDKRN